MGSEKILFEYKITEFVRKFHCFIDVSHPLNVPNEQDGRPMLNKLLPGYFRPKPIQAVQDGIFKYLFEVRKGSATYQTIDRTLAEVKRLYEVIGSSDGRPDCLFFVDRQESTIENIKTIFDGWAKMNTPQSHLVLADFKRHYLNEIHMYMKQSASRLFPAEVHQYRRRIDRRYVLVDYIDTLKAVS